MARNYPRRTGARSPASARPQSAPGDGQHLQDGQRPQHGLDSCRRVSGSARPGRGRTAEPAWLAALTIPKMVPNEREPNSSRDRHRDEPGGPAVEAREGMQVDAEPVEGEPPREARDGRARGDDVPAVNGVRPWEPSDSWHGPSREINRPRRAHGTEPRLRAGAPLKPGAGSSNIFCATPHEARRPTVKLDVGMLTHDLQDVPDVARRPRRSATTALDGRGGPRSVPAVRARGDGARSASRSAPTSRSRSRAARWSHAQIAWDLQAASAGRFILGLGTQVKGAQRAPLLDAVESPGPAAARDDPADPPHLGRLADTAREPASRASTTTSA